MRSVRVQNGQTPLRLRLGRNEIGQRLGFEQIEFTVEKRTAGEFAGFGVANIRKGGQAVQKRGDNSLAAMNLELSAILAGEAMRGREE